MTMNVTITEDHDDSYQGRVRAHDKYADAPEGDAVDHVSDLGVLKRKGDAIKAYCTSNRSLEIVEEALEP